MFAKIKSYLGALTMTAILGYAVYGLVHIVQMLGEGFRENMRQKRTQQ